MQRTGRFAEGFFIGDFYKIFEMMKIHNATSL